MRGTFRLVRHFSLVSLLAIAAVAVMLGAYDAHKAEGALLAQGEQRNAAQLQLILNQLSATERGTLDGLIGLQAAPARDDPLVQRLHRRFDATVSGTRIVKLKLYNPRGITVYSSEAAQIGEDKSAYPGFLKALGGTPASQLSHRETFESFGGRLKSVDVIGSYLPVRGATGSVDGVIEIYDDVTRLAGTIESERWQVMLLSLGMLGALYLVLLMIVARAERVLLAQEQALRREVSERTEVAEEARRAQRATEKAQRETEAAYALAMDARRAAVAAERARETLVASLGEGMRAPLNGIVGLSQVLRGEAATAVQRDHVGRLRDCAMALLDLLDDHTNLARRAGEAAVDEPFAPEAVVRDVVALFGPAVRANGARLDSAVDPGCPPVVLGQAGGLRHLLRDLVAAALAHVPDGTLAVSVDAAPDGDDSARALLRWSVRLESPLLFQGLAHAATAGLVALDPSAPDAQLASPAPRNWRGTFFDTRAVDRSAAAMGAVLSLKSDGRRYIAVRLVTRHRVADPAALREVEARPPAEAAEILFPATGTPIGTGRAERDPAAVVGRFAPVPRETQRVAPSLA